MIRVISLSKNEGIYSILLQTDSNYNDCNLKLAISGEVGIFKSKILSAKSNDEELEFSGDVVKALQLKANQIAKIEVQLDYNDYYGLEVELHGNKE